MRTSYRCRNSFEWDHRAEIEAEYQRLSKKAMKDNDWAWDMQGVMHWEMASENIRAKQPKLREGYACVFTFAGNGG